MKTFETEKHNIPDGATHYQDESSSRHFAWFKDMDNDVCKIMTHHSDKWRDVETKRYGLHAKPIPQTKEVEWENGDNCQHENGIVYTFIGKCDNPKQFDCVLMDSSGNTVLSFINELSKPETPEAKKERERDESAKEIMIDLCGDKVFEDRDWDYHKKFTHSAKMAFKLVDLGYSKEK